MASARFFEQLFERLPYALMVLDRELRYVAANAAYLQTTGAKLEDLLGRCIFEAFPNDPEDPNSASVEMLRLSFERVLATRQPDELAAIVYRVARYPGGPLEERIWSARHAPLLDEHGEVEFIVQETEDITELRNRREVAPSMVGTDVVERAVRSQTAATNLGIELRDLRQMFAQAPGFMCFTRGREHVFEIVNAAYMQLVGHRHIVGKPVAAALPEVVGQGFVKLLDSVYETGGTYIGKELRVQLQRTPDAELEDRYIDFVYQPIRGAANEVIGIFVQGQDVTEQKQAARDLAFAEAQLRFMIESIPVQVWTATPQGQLDFVSDRVGLYFQSPTTELLGNGWITRLHPDDMEASTARWKHSLETGEPYEVEFRLRRGDGVFRWHLGRANAQRAADGTILRWFGTNTDIHDAKVAVDGLRMRSEYEQRLLGIVSHDLRNPLSSVALGAELLLSKELDESTRKIVARVARSAERATRLIADLLDFAKLRIGTTIPVNPRPANLRGVVMDVVDELQMTSPTRRIEVRHRGAEDGRWDANRIAQVLSNLLGNAIQHGPPNAPITIESRIEGDTACVSVTNAGPPIPEADLPHLFEPFRRGRNASTAGGSVGLGLYISREVVVAHGGSIDVESTEERGTCFTVHLRRFT